MKKPVREHRPWGYFDVLLDSASFKIKRITVNPGCRLSLQSHQHRNEHWIITKGPMLVTVNGSVRECQENDHVYIAKGDKHRMENPGTEPAALIEVQTGHYFGEDDIIRYEDDYHRV